MPGNNDIAATYRGRDGVLGYFERRRELAKGTLRLITDKILRSGQLLVQNAHGDAELGGKQVLWEALGVFRLRGWRITECSLIPCDQARFDQSWSSPAGG